MTRVREAVLVSNGPGELYGWVRPVLAALRARDPDLKLTVSLIPCQFASGAEASIARTFDADTVTDPGDYLRFISTGKRPEGMGAQSGFVLSLGGNMNMAITLGKKLGYPTYRYSFEPYWHKQLRMLFLHDSATQRKARLLGAPSERLKVIGNLVADAVEQAVPIANPGTPHIVLIPGSRNEFAIHLIPLMIAVADKLGQRYPEARFVWPVSRLLKDETVRAGIQGEQLATFGGCAGVRDGQTVRTPNGTRIELIEENERYQHMRSADIAITIPGTNTLEFGIAAVPSVVVLPLNRPEAIPLEGIGHWLGLIPLVGKPLKRFAVKQFVTRLSQPVSLPNRFSGEPLMQEILGVVSADEVANVAAALLDDDAKRQHIRARLQATMPQQGAARKLIDAIYDDIS